MKTDLYSECQSDGIQSLFTLYLFICAVNKQAFQRGVPILTQTCLSLFLKHTHTHTHTHTPPPHPSSLSLPWNKYQSTLLRFCQLKKKEKQCTMWVKFICGKMRTIAWETAPQTALRNCSTEVGEGQSSWFWWSGMYVGQHTFLHKVAARLVKVTASHEEQMSLLVNLLRF